MSARLRELIRSVRNCKTAAEERAVIAKECAAIRTALKEKHPYRARNVAKLMYIHMLGYPTHFGQMECINLIVSQKYPEKRIGYLALMILLDETQEVLPLIEHTLKKDLDDKNQFVQALALTALANIASEDICRDLSAEVEKLLFHSPYIRKKAALCAVRIIKKCPDLIENYVDKLDQLLNEKNHGVLLTTTTLITEIVKTDKKYRVHFRKLIPTLLKLLKTLLMSAYALEHDVSGVADPFLQVKILRLLRALGKGSTKASEMMSDVLAQVATNTESTKNPGNAILYECVRTILEINAESGLRTLAVNQLGKFLVSRENNLRFVSLHALTKVVSTDSQAVFRHINTIIECLKDHDVSIRKRALELIYVLVNASNVQLLVNELMNYLQHATDDLKESITTKICTLVEKFAPSNEWKVNTLLQLITLAGQYVREEIAFLFVALVTQCPEIQSAVVNKLVITLNGLIPKAHLLSKQETLLQVSVWCIGEYGDLINHEDMTEENMIKLLVQILVSQQLSSMTKAFVLTSLLKLSDRWPAYTEQIKAIVSQYRSCIDVEIQQRSYEYANLLKWPDVSKIVLAKMPAFTVQHYLMQENEESNGKDQAPSESAEHKSQQVEIPSAKNILPVSTEEEANPLLDLITTKHVKPTNTPEPDANYLDTLLSQATVKEASLVDFAAADIANVSHTFSQTLHIYDKNGLQIDFELSKPEPNALNTTEIKVSFTNQLSHALSNFNFLAAVPKYINMDIFKASSDVIPPKSAGKVTQRIALKNTMHGEKPLVMKYKVSYTCQGTNENIVEQGAVNNFPKNF